MKSDKTISKLRKHRLVLNKFGIETYLELHKMNFRKKHVQLSESVHIHLKMEDRRCNIRKDR